MALDAVRHVSILRGTSRSNAREAERLVLARLGTDLKGLSFPIHVMIEPDAGKHPSPLIRPHQIPRGISKNRLVPLGNDLFVLTPELTVLLHQQAKTKLQVAKMMFEACGLFSIVPSTPRVRFVIRELTSHGILTPGRISTSRLSALYDARGRRLGFFDDEGEPLEWAPFFDRFGQLTDLWKRPPLTSVEHILATLDDPGISGARGVARARAALKMVRDGAASPAEVQAMILLCSRIWDGGEAWGDPLLNMRIDFDVTQRLLANQSYCVADALWRDMNSVLEINGESAHADRWGFREHSGRTAALENAGYSVKEITPSQMANLEMFDAILPSLADALGFSLQKRTPAFLMRRDALHRELFGEPYDPF